MLRIILSNIIILNIILRINHEILDIFRYKKRIIRGALMSGIIAGIVLWLYPIIIEPYLPEVWSITSNHTLISIIPLIIYISLRTLVLQNKISKKDKLIFSTLFISIPLLYGVIQTINNQFISTTVGFFLILASGEEVLKLTATKSRIQPFLIQPTDIIICGIISGLGFAFIEGILTTSHLTQTVQRFPLYLLHAIFTGTIAVAIHWSKKKEKTIIAIAGLLVVIIVHTLYNSFVAQTNSILFRTLTITASYFLYSYIQFQANSTYALKTKN